MCCVQTTLKLSSPVNAIWSAMLTAYSHIPTLLCITTPGPCVFQGLPAPCCLCWEQCQADQLWIQSMVTGQILGCLAETCTVVCHEAGQRCHLASTERLHQDSPNMN